MIVLVEEKHDLPLVTFELVFPAGAVRDAVGKEGLARHAAELMRRGTSSRDRFALDAALDQLGASLDVEVTQDEVAFSGRCLARNLAATLRIAGEVLAAPRLDEAEHERLRRESLALLDEMRDDDSTMCSRFFERAVLSGHPYGRTAVGTEASLRSLTRDDAADWVRRNINRGHMIVGFAGDVDATAVQALADEVLGRLPNQDPPAAPVLAAPPIAPGRRTILVDKPERVQSQILIGHPAPRHGDADWLPLHVGATVFGGMFTSRLMTEVRVKRGWSYGAGCRVARARGAHTFRMRVFPSADQTPETLELVLGMFEEIARDGVTEDELAFAKSYLEGSHAFEIDTPAERLSHHIDELVLDLPRGYYATFLDRLRAVTRDDVNAAIRRWWHPQSATIAITCTAEAMQPRLAHLPLGDIQVQAFDSY